MKSPKRKSRSQRIEDWHFQLFRERIENFPEGEVVHRDKPDFRIISRNGILGIEHTLVLKPETGEFSVKAVESQEDQIKKWGTDTSDPYLPKLHPRGRKVNGRSQMVQIAEWTSKAKK